MSWFVEWLRGRTPRQVEARQKALENPRRFLIVAGTIFGGGMAIINLIEGDGYLGVVIGLASGLVYGPLVLWLIRRSERRRTRSGSHDAGE